MELKELVAEFQRLRSFGKSYEIWVMDVMPRTGKDNLPLIVKVDSRAVGFPTINNSDFVIMMHPMTWLDIQDSLVVSISGYHGQDVSATFMGIRIPVYDDDDRRMHFAKNTQRHVTIIPDMRDFREAYRNMR